MKNDDMFMPEFAPGDVVDAAEMFHALTEADGYENIFTPGFGAGVRVGDDEVTDLAAVGRYVLACLSGALKPSTGFTAEEVPWDLVLRPKAREVMAEVMAKLQDRLPEHVRWSQPGSVNTVHFFVWKRDPDSIPKQP
jgi:hypothetical protein